MIPKTQKKTRTSGGEATGKTHGESQYSAVHALASPDVYKGKSRLAILASLPTNQRWAYFRNQLLARTITTISIICIVIYLVIQIFTPVQPPLLYVAVFRTAINDNASAQTLQRESATYFHVRQGRKNGILIDPDFDMTSQGLNKLQTMLANNDIDILIANQKDFQTLSGYGYMNPLNTTLHQDQRKKLSEQLVSFPGFDDDSEDDGSGKGTIKNYGLKLKESALWTSLPAASNSAILGLAQDSQRTAFSIKYISYMFK